MSPCQSTMLGEIQREIEPDSCHLRNVWSSWRGKCKVGTEIIRWWYSSFPMAVVTNCHRLGAFHNRNSSVMILEARSPNEGVSRAVGPPETWGEAPLCPFSFCWLLRILLVVLLHRTPDSSLTECSTIPRVPVTEFRTHRDLVCPYLNFIILGESLYPNKVSSWSPVQTWIVRGTLVNLLK